MSAAAPPDTPGIEHRHVDAHGLRTHVAVAGPEDSAQPPVVLLHGWPQHGWLWRDVQQALADAGLRSYAIDLRGHGWTDAPATGYDKAQFATDVLHALDALGVDRFAIAGHDWGGYTTQLVTLRAPERIERWAVCNIVPVWAAGGPDTFKHLHRGAYQVPLVLPVIGQLTHRYAMKAYLLGVPKADKPVYAERWQDPQRAAAGQQVYRRFQLEDLPAALRGAYAGQRLTPPGLVLHGKKDPVVRPEMVEGFREHADDVRIEWFDDLGHFLIDEAPERIAPRLTTWFAEGR